MYQDITPSHDALTELLEGTNPSTRGDPQVNDFDYIIPLSPLSASFYSHFDTSMLPLPSPVPSQQISMDNNSTSTNTIPIDQNDSLTKPKQYKSNKNKDQRSEKREGVSNKKHTPDSTKSMGKILKKQHKASTDKIITPSLDGYSRKSTKSSKETKSISKGSQTALSFKQQNGPIETARYMSMHQALMKLESMAKPEKKLSNSPSYVFKNQKERQMVLQSFNIDWASLNKLEAQRFYNISCTRKSTIREES